MKTLRRGGKLEIEELLTIYTDEVMEGKKPDKEILLIVVVKRVDRN